MHRYGSLIKINPSGWGKEEGEKIMYGKYFSGWKTLGKTFFFHAFYQTQEEPSELSGLPHIFEICSEFTKLIHIKFDRVAF